MTAISTHLGQSLRGLIDELRTLRLAGDRARLCLQTVCSVVLAVALADCFGLSDRWWVALSAYAVFRADVIVVLRRCAERLAGTLAGAAIGLLLATLLLPHANLLALALAAVAGIGIYNMIGSPWTYSWVLGTVTALMVLSEAAHVPSVPRLALDRVMDVATGVSATLLIAAASQVLLRWRRKAQPLPASKTDHATSNSPAPTRGLDQWRAAQAWQGALSVAVLAGIDTFVPLPSMPQAMVSVVAVLLVPLPSLLQGTAREEIRARMFNRVLGCLCAALVAAPLLPLIGSMPALCLLVLAVGVWLAAHVQSGSAHVSYIGTQFGVGFIMVFVQDHGWSPHAAMTWERLGGIVLALLVLTLVMALTALLRRRSH